MAQAGSGSSSKNVNNTTSYDHTVSISILGDSHFQLPIRRHPTRLTDISEDAELYQNEASVEPNPDLKYDSDSDSSQVVFTPEVGLSEDEEIEPANTERMVTEKVLQPVTENLWKFHEAIKQGDTATVNTYKDTKVFDCPESSTGYTPLVMAIVENQLDMARFLLEHGADIHQRANKLPPVVYAATRTVRAPQFMQLLLDFGAALNTISGPHQYNALHHAAVNGCIDAVNFLVCQGMDIEGTCWQGRTPLLLAAEQGHTMIVKLLLAKGAELHHRCRSGGTGLAWAVCDDHVDTIEYLLKEGNDVNDCDNAGFSAISTACSRGSIEAVELLIKKGANINVISSLPRGFTPIMAAAVAGHADVVQILIEHGADLTIRNGAGNTILEAAMAHGHHDTVGILLEALGGDDYPQESIALDIAMANSNTTIREIMVSSGLIDSTVQEPENIHSVDWILEQGGDMVKPRAMSNMMYGALYANALDVVAALLANGCDPNKHLSPEQTPLHFAVDQNNIPLIDLLLNWGANPAIEAYGPDDLTYTPLHQALIALDRDRGKDTSTIDRLLASGRCKLMTGNDARSSAFGYVLSHYSRWTHGVAEIMIFRMIQSIEDIHEDRSDDGSTLMHAAVWHGRVDLVDILLSKGANINAIDHQGCTSFILECQRGTRMLGCLLARGADPHAKDIDSQCALHAAAAQGNLKAINFLLNIGLPVDVLDRDQYTPLVWAVITGQEDAALHLLKRGARLETKKLRRGRTLLHIAASLGMERLVTILLRNTDLDVNAKDDMGWTPLALACRKGSPQLLTTFLEAGADIETANDTLDRPLHLALIACNLIGARLLIWGGADITARGSHGRTPLHFAAKHVNLHLVRLLIRHDASISALDDAGQTPLCLCSGSDIAQVFIDQGASADHVDKYGWTPLHHAVANGQVNVFKVLLRAGGRLDARTIDDGLSVSERIEDLLDERLRTAFEDSVSGVQRGEVDQKRCLYDL